MSQPTDPPQNAPVVLGGRYEIHRRIARGGMAEVFLARDQALDRPVAVKILFPEFATDPSFVERFRREAQAAANLTHPNIVGVYDWGAESGTYYIVMEYVDGQPLSEVLRGAGPLHPRRAAEIAFEVAGALGFAHQRGVVHRDVKPGNVLISTNGVAKVTDFGIARAISSGADELTQAGSVMGTAAYFSPEQAQGFPVDARSDLYSLGVVLFETLCGRPPFAGESPVSIAYKHVQEAPPRPSTLIGGIPPGLEAIVLKLLAKDPDLRYRSADDLRADLRRWLDGVPTIAESEQGIGDATVAMATVAPPVIEELAPTTVARPVTAAAPIANEDLDYEEEAPRRNGAFIAVSLVLLAALIGLGVWVYSNLKSDSTTGEMVSVPRVTSFDQEDAVKAIRAVKLNPVIQQEASDDAPEGTVIRQSPKPNVEREVGSDVVLYVSSGAEAVEVPNLVGLEQAAAVEQLENLKLTATVTSIDSTEAAGKVVETVPATGGSVAAGGSVELRVSNGKGPVPIPSVAKKSVDEAKSALTAAGFTVGTVSTQASADVPKDKVIGTEPASAAPAKSTVNLIVSAGPQKVKVPAVKGQPEEAARQAITSRGLEAEVVTQSVSAGDTNAGRVISVSPAAGTEVEPNSTVTLTVGVATTATTTTAAPSTTTTTTTSP
jgi:serine/threonine-protein kinase